jgi:hypothetical protein
MLAKKGGKANFTTLTTTDSCWTWIDAAGLGPWLARYCACPDLIIYTQY